MTIAGSGRYAGLAPCGTALTARHVAALADAVSLAAAGVLVAFDSDQAGLRAAVRTCRLLAALTEDPSAVVLPAGQDPAQLLRDHGPGALTAALADCARPLADLVINAEVARWDRWLQHPEGQLHALRATAPLIAGLPPRCVARQVAWLAQRLGLDHATVTEAVTSALPDIVAAQQASPDRRMELGRVCPVQVPDPARAPVPEARPARQAVTTARASRAAGPGPEQAVRDRAGDLTFPARTALTEPPHHGDRGTGGPRGPAADPGVPLPRDGKAPVGPAAGRRGPNARNIAANHPTPVGAPTRLTRNTSASLSEPRTSATSVGSMYTAASNKISSTQKAARGQGLHARSFPLGPIPRAVRRPRPAFTGRLPRSLPYGKACAGTVEPELWISRTAISVRCGYQATDGGDADLLPARRSNVVLADERARLWPPPRGRNARRLR